MTSTDLLTDYPITIDLSAFNVSGDGNTKHSIALGISDVIYLAFPQQTEILNQFNKRLPTSNPL